MSGNAKRIESSDMVTVLEVFAMVGAEPDSESAWSVGKVVQEKWSTENGGELPRKELRKKKNGAGSHCFAVYPMAFVPTIKDVIAAHCAVAAAQPDLFTCEDET